MNKLITFLVLDGFVLLNVFVMATSGLGGLEALIASANAWSILIAVDLVIALGLLAVLLVKDARARGVSPLPYLLLTAFTGSIGPLLYLVRRRTV